MATTIQQAGRLVALGRIRVPDNVRALDGARVEALAGSIKLQGMLVPLVVREGEDGFELVAGFHRIAGFRAFLALNRCVRKGEKAIKILGPVAVKQRDDDGEETGEKRIFFRSVAVFDVSQTDPLPGTEPIPLAPPADLAAR
jgi:hypothetical protein